MEPVEGMALVSKTRELVREGLGVEEIAAACGYRTRWVYERALRDEGYRLKRAVVLQQLGGAVVAAPGLPQP